MSGTVTRVTKFLRERGPTVSEPMIDPVKAHCQNCDGERA